jgi:hypothetical protein
MACIAAAAKSTQPGMPNIEASIPHIPLVAQQLGNMTKPITLRPGQRGSSGTGFAQEPPIVAVPQVLVAGSAQHAVMKPIAAAVDEQVAVPHATSVICPGSTAAEPLRPATLLLPPAPARPPAPPLPPLAALPAFPAIPASDLPPVAASSSPQAATTAMHNHTEHTMSVALSVFIIESF